MPIYFAYGSNMFTKRLNASDRSPEARFICSGHIHGHALKFHKRGADGSGKANAIRTENQDDIVYGALFEIGGANKSQLAKAEGVGKGYQECGVNVILPDKRITAISFIADPDAIQDDLKPFDWYLDLVIAGAREHKLPANYIEQLEKVESIKDMDEGRIKLALRYLY